MKAFFLSYAHADSPLADTVERTLKTDGLRIWRDRDDLVPGIRFADSIQRAIQEQCSGVVVLVTRQSLDSGFISNVELPEAYHNRLPIVPLFVGVPVEEVKRSAPGAIGFDLTAFQGANELPSPESGQESIFRAKVDDIAFKILRESLSRRCASGQTGPLRVALHSYQYVADEPADVDLDWTAYFEASLPPVDVWNERLLPALRRVKRAITESGLGTPEIYLPFGGHLSIGLALGFVFRQQTRFHFSIQQNGEVWTTRIDPASRKAVPPLQYDREQADVDDPRSQDVALGLSISHDLRGALDQVAGMRFKRNLLPPGGGRRGSVPDGACARWWADQIADHIGEIQDRHRIEVLHLYASMPFAMAVMVGWLLNARGTIQVHERNKYELRYQLACTLRG